MLFWPGLKNKRQLSGLTPPHAMLAQELPSLVSPQRRLVQ
jgi:hypothetical protein